MIFKADFATCHRFALPCTNLAKRTDSSKVIASYSIEPSCDTKERSPARAAPNKSKALTLDSSISLSSSPPGCRNTLPDHKRSLSEMV
eukprot:6460423-Amphidinium_carterae.1